MKRFKKALQIALTLALLAGAVAVTITNTPAVSYGCETAGCD